MISVHYVSLPLQWTVLQLTGGGENDFSNRLVKAAKIERRLARILGEWERTPYNIRCAEKGVGSSCAGFICRLLAELYRIEPVDIRAIPEDMSFHNRAGAVAGLKWFLRTFPAAEKLESERVQPGDVIITEPLDGGPGHALMVGPREGTMWQNLDCQVGVHYTGLSVPSTYRLHSVYRFKDREDWA